MTAYIWILVLSSTTLDLNEQHKPLECAGESQGSPGHPETGPEKVLDEN